MPVTITRTDMREVRGPAVDDEQLRSRVASAHLRLPAGPYAKGGFPVTARQFGLSQLRDVRVEATDRYWFAFELVGALTPDEDSTRGVLRVFQGAEVEDGTELPDIDTTGVAEGI